MHKHHCLILIGATLLAACGSPTNATPSMTGTAKPSAPTVIRTPTQTPAPISIPISEIVLDHCTRILQTHISDSGTLNILYANDINELTTYSQFGYSDSHTGLTRRSDDTQQAIPYDLPENAQDPLLSPNGELVVFRFDRDENLSEIRVIDVNGQNERTVATLDYSEIEKRYSSETAMLSYSYEWIPNTTKIVYSVDVYLEDSELAPKIYDQVVIVDAISGITFFLESPEGIQYYKISLDGSQIAVRSEQELRVVSTDDGQTLFKNPGLPTNGFVFSPDSSYILEFIEGGIQSMDTKNGRRQLIPLDYTVMHTRAEGPALSFSPNYLWADDTHILLSSLNAEEQFVFAINQADPDWTFTIFQVDIANGTIETIQTFDGFPLGSSFSPNRQFLAFWKYEGQLPDQRRDLYIVDVVSGEILEIIETGEFWGWFTDSQRYLYATGVPYPPPGKGDPGGSTEVEIKYFLGQVAKEALQINWDSPALANVRDARWLDANHLLGDCEIYTFE